MPREAALETLRRVERGALARETLDGLIRRRKLADRDRDLARELVGGSLRHLEALEGPSRRALGARVHGDVGAGDRRGAGPAVGLQDVAVEADREARDSGRHQLRVAGHRQAKAGDGQRRVVRDKDVVDL